MFPFSGSAGADRAGRVCETIDRAAAPPATPNRASRRVNFVVIIQCSSSVTNFRCADGPRRGVRRYVVIPIQTAECAREVTARDNLAARRTGHSNPNSRPPKFTFGNRDTPAILGLRNDFSRDHLGRSISPTQRSPTSERGGKSSRFATSRAVPQTGSQPRVFNSSTSFCTDAAGTAYVMTRSARAMLTPTAFPSVSTNGPPH